ncbi:hypothetical protein [Chitinophaga sp. YIM B06452]|uniref:hypothetical protein n=1 Tax=Chitinophaga sp. YIM B06452 TaxID=3082158 RepID=UPI0031FE83D7
MKKNPLPMLFFAAALTLALSSFAMPTSSSINGVESKAITFADNDEDKDGVVDEDDLCPGTPADVPVDANGCPI